MLNTLHQTTQRITHYAKKTLKKHGKQGNFNNHPLKVFKYLDFIKNLKATLNTI